MSEPDQANPALATIIRQFETIFHSSSDGLWVCDGEGVVLNINKASEILNGIKASDVVGHDIQTLVAQGIFDHSVTSRVLASGRRQTIMQHIPKTDRYLLSTGTPSLDEEGRIVLIVVNERDITELNILRREFEASEKARDKYREELRGLSLLELERNEIIAESPAMRRILQMARKLAQIGAASVLILGESGTGKGLLARFLHKNSGRSGSPLVEINCAALPETLLEAELFGYERGAFTGADEKGKIGLIELAQGGTLFLDEIGDLPLSLQAKLLKYLDNGEIRRVGGTRSIQVRCATIAATNRDLPALVEEKLFRRDLYYRLNAFVLHLPPLRQRREDIAGLARFYLEQANRTYRAARTISPRAVRRLEEYDFPGNVRELRNLLENAVVMGSEDCIEEFIVESVSGSQHQGGREVVTAVERGGSLAAKIMAYEREVLLAAKKNYGSTREVARQLGISQPSVVRKYQRHGIV